MRRTSNKMMTMTIKTEKELRTLQQRNRSVLDRIVTPLPLPPS